MKLEADSKRSVLLNIFLQHQLGFKRKLNYVVQLFGAIMFSGELRSLHFLPTPYEGGNSELPYLELYNIEAKKLIL